MQAGQKLVCPTAYCTVLTTTSCGSGTAKNGILYLAGDVITAAKTSCVNQWTVIPKTTTTTIKTTTTIAKITTTTSPVWWRWKIL